MPMQGCTGQWLGMGGTGGALRRRARALGSWMCRIGNAGTRVEPARPLYGGGSARQCVVPDSSPGHRPTDRSLSPRTRASCARINEPGVSGPLSSINPWTTSSLPKRSTTCSAMRTGRPDGAMRTATTGHDDARPYPVGARHGVCASRWRRDDMPRRRIRPASPNVSRATGMPGVVAVGGEATGVFGCRWCVP